MLVVNGKIRFDHGLWILRAAMRPPVDLALDQICEPALHRVDPRGTHRREVQVEMWVRRQSVVDHRGLVRLVVVQHQQSPEDRRQRRVDALQECAELDRSLLRVAIRPTFRQARPQR